MLPGKITTHMNNYLCESFESFVSFKLFLSFVSFKSFVSFISFKSFELMWLNMYSFNSLCEKGF